MVLLPLAGVACVPGLQVEWGANWSALQAANDVSVIKRGSMAICPPLTAPPNKNVSGSCSVLGEIGLTAGAGGDVGGSGQEALSLHKSKSMSPFNKSECKEARRWSLLLGIPEEGNNLDAMLVDGWHHKLATGTRI